VSIPRNVAGWFEGRVTRAWSESTTLRGLAFECEPVARGHAMPGQYVRVRLDGGDNPYAVGVFALIMAAAATALVMIVRDSARFVWRRFRPLREPDQPDYGPGRIEASRRLGHTRELPPSGGVRKQIR